jgi:hypothetical protein
MIKVFHGVFVAGIFIFSVTRFNYIKRTEQSNIWVGLSKETAHQLGTPLSSLMDGTAYKGQLKT